MNVGDRVRLMTGREEGIVTRILSDELVEVSIDDFPVPVMRRELVVVAAEEAKAFGGSELAPVQSAPAAPTKEKTPPAPPAPKGLYLALVAQTSELLAMHVINHTDADVLFTYGEEKNGQYRGLASNKLGPRSASQPLGHWHLKDFDKWPAAVVQVLPHQVNGPVLYEALLRRIAFKASSFYTSRRPAPVLQREAYLFQLDEKAVAPVSAEQLQEQAQPKQTAQPKPEPAQVQATQLQQKLTEKLRGDAPAPAPQPKPEPAKVITPPPHEVDLHLEALRPEGGEGMSNTAILDLQISTFEDALSRALATNMHEIIFIHGSGNGTLRKELHKRLSRNRDIKFFEEARKEKFGYGATLVRLK